MQRKTNKTTYKTTPPRGAKAPSPRGARAPPPKTWADTCTDIRDGIWDCFDGMCNMITRKTRKRKSPGPSENSPLLQRMDRNNDDDSAYARRQKYEYEPFDYDDRPSQSPPPKFEYHGNSNNPAEPFNYHNRPPPSARAKPKPSQSPPPKFEYHGNSNNPAEPFDYDDRPSQSPPPKFEYHSNNPADLFADLLNTDTYFITMFDNINLSKTQFLTIEELAKFIDTMPLPEEHKKELKIQARTNINFNHFAFSYNNNFKEYLLNIYRTIPEHSKPKFIEFILNYNKEERARKNPQNPQNPPKTTSSTKNTNPDKTNYEKIAKETQEREERLANERDKARKNPQNSSKPSDTSYSFKPESFKSESFKFPPSKPPQNSKSPPKKSDTSYSFNYTSDSSEAEADKAKADKAKADADKSKADKAKAEADKAKADKAKAEADESKAEADKSKADKAKAEAEAKKKRKAEAAAEARSIQEAAEAASSRMVGRAKYLRILGIPPSDDGDIVKAYRNLAKIWHPDKWKSEDDKAYAEARFKIINGAYSKLLGLNGELRVVGGKTKENKRFLTRKSSSRVSRRHKRTSP